MRIAVLLLVLPLALTGCDRLRAAAHAFTAPEALPPAPPPPPGVAEVEGEEGAAEGEIAPAPLGDEAGADGVTETSERVAVTTSGGDTTQKGVHIGDENGVHLGRDGDDRGVTVGGEYGVLVGDQEEVKGVRVGGEKGVVVGKDDETTGVRVGGEKGVEVGREGLSIGGKKIFGKKEGK